MGQAMAKEFHAIFPNSQLCIIKNANHFVQLDQPQSVAELISARFSILTKSTLAFSKVPFVAVSANQRKLVSMYCVGNKVT